MPASRATTLWLIRHAKAGQPDGVPEPEWPLTDAGHQQAAELAGFLHSQGVEHLYASPFLRAQQTLLPYADMCRKPVQILPDLRERRLAGELIDDFMHALRLGFGDAEHCLAGGESMAACRARMGEAISRIAAAHRGETIAACSHGVVISAFIGGLDPTVGFDFWQALKNPHLIRLDMHDGTIEWTDMSVTRG